MDNSSNQQSDSELRKRAEKKLRGQQAEIGELSSADARHLIHELQVHQIELEMQNEELRRTQLELQTTRDRFSDLYDFAPVGYLTLDSDDLILEANLTTAEMLGIERNNLIGQRLTHFVFPEDQAIYYFHRRKLVEYGEAQRCEIRLVKADGSPFHAQLIGDAARGNEGRLNQCRMAVLDITDQKRAENALRENERLLRTIAENYPNSYVSIIEKDLTVGFTSGQEFQKQKLNPAQFVDLTLDQVFGDQAEVVRERYLKTFEGEEQSFELFANAQYQYCRTVPLYAQDGTIPRILAVVENITERKRAEEEIKSLAKFPSENPNPILRIAQNGDLLYINESGLRLLPEWNLQVGKPVLPILREAALQAIENKTTQTLDLEHDRRLYSLFFTPVIAAGYANLYAGDITERKRAEETLQASEIRYRRLFEAAKDGILILDPETGQIVDVNPFLIDLLGYSYNEYLGKKLWEMGPFKNVVASQDAFGELRKAGYIRYEELPLETKSGKHIAVEFVSNVYEADHKTVIQCNIRDITERKWAEEALKASEQRYRSVVENTGVGIIVIQDGKQVFYNPQIYKLLEYTEEDFLSIDFVALIHPDDRQLMLNRIGQRLAGEPVDTGPVEVRTITKSGKVRWCEASSVAIDWEGKPAIQAFIHDITERRQAEEALAHERDLLHTLMDNAPDLIYFKDTSSRFTRINQAEAEVLGVPSPEEAVGKTDADFFTPEHAQAALADEQKIVQTGTPLIGKVEHIRHANGEWRWVLTTKVPSVENEQVTGMVGITTDITEIKQTEEALQRYADRLRLLREVDIAILSAHLPELIAQNTLQQLNKLVPCQRSSVTLFDFEAETFTTLAVKTEGETDLKPGLRHPLIHFAGDFDKLRQNRVSIEEDLRDLTRPSPVIRTLIVEGVRTYVGVPLIVKADLIGSLNLAAASPDFFTAEHLEIAQEVAGQLAVAVQQARLYEELQKHSQMLEQAVEKATAELREANEALKTLDQLKDSFLSTAAHELRTPLTSIQGFSEILLTRELDEDRKKYYLDTINKQSAQLAQIIDDLLDISRLEAGKGLEIKSEPVDLGLLLVETVQPFIETSVKHHFRLEGLTETPPVQGDPFRLEQVIRNLLSNAVKYSPEGGSITIHTRVSGKYFEVGVQDEGIGLTPEQQAHLFEKFYRADESNRSTGGTGLGLAICKLIVEGHGGHIWAESESGAGSTFAFSIPLAT